MSNQNCIVWIHGDCLSPHGPALQAHPESPALWVWDDALLHEWRISLKRIVFMYECLLDLPVDIRRGDIVTEIVRFAQAHQTRRVATVQSPSPRFEKICRQLELAGLTVEKLPLAPFIDYNGHLDLKRFSRYWRIAKKFAFNL